MRFRRVALALIALLFVAHLARSVRFFDRWDEIEFIQGAQQLAAGHMVDSDKRLPLFSFSIAAVRAVVRPVLPDWSVAARLATQLLGAGTLLALAGLASEAFGAAAGLAAALLLATCPLALAAAAIVHPVVPLALLVTLAAWSLARHLRTGSIGALALANVLVALAGFTRPEGFAFAPLAFWLDARVCMRRGDTRPRPAAAAGLAAAAATILLSAAWFATHAWYARAVATTLGQETRLAHAASYVAAYLRALPSLLSYPAALLAAAGLVRLVVDAFARRLDARARAFALVGGWLAVALLAGLASYPYFTTIYLLTLVPVVLALAAHGLDGLARLGRPSDAPPRRAVVAAGLAVAVAVNLPLAEYEITQYGRVLADYHDCCLWVRDRRQAEAPAPSGFVVAMDPNHLRWWTAVPALSYRREYAVGARHVVLSDLFAQNFGFDYDEELRWLAARGGTVVFSSERSLRPTLGMTLCQPYRDVFTPRILDVRWTPQRFRSAVVELPLR